jgi:hypothetical protein
MPVFASLVEFDFDADFDARACGEPEVGGYSVLMIV